MFVGLSGTVKLDHNADRVANYRIWHLPKGFDAYQDFIDIEMIDSIRGVVMTSERYNSVGCRSILVIFSQLYLRMILELTFCMFKQLRCYLIVTEINDLSAVILFKIT